jgi:hypothetical protein
MSTKNIEVSTITHNLPNHKYELNKAEEKILKLKRHLNLIKQRNNIDDEIHDKLYEEIVGALDWVGRLSMHIFELRDDLELLYEIAYPKSPRMGYELFDKHYSNLHHPYSILKNRCFALLEDLDKTYIFKYKKTPPNWKL